MPARVVGCPGCLSMLTQSCVSFPYKPNRLGYAIGWSHANRFEVEGDPWN